MYFGTLFLLCYIVTLLVIYKKLLPSFYRIRPSHDEINEIYTYANIASFFIGGTTLIVLMTSPAHIYYFLLTFVYLHLIKTPIRQNITEKIFFITKRYDAPLYWGIRLENLFHVFLTSLWLLDYGFNIRIFEIQNIIINIF